ncbi:MAG: hypothetical protein NTY20_03990 [Candidatus Aenigmarchaeota archaeon]|nr:hypothetical protein [Candidatus Aenigmarchaeota archaeon]
MATLIELVIPFLFMLAVVYGSLDVSGVFRNKRVNALIAVVFAFFALTYEPAMLFINQVMPFAIMFFVVFFFIGFVIKIAKKGVEKDYNLIIIILGLVLLLFATQGSGFINNFLPGFEEQASNIMIASTVVFIGVILLAAYKLSIK